MTARLRVKIDVTDDTLGTAGRQLPFALSVAINETLKSAQAKQREGMAERFTLRRKAFADRSVKITQFAKKDTLVGELALSPPGGEARADIFGKFEKGGVKRPRDGRTIAVPIVGSPVKRTARSIVSEKNRPRTLLAGGQAQANRSAFIVREDDGTGLIFQRRGKGKRSKIVPVFALITQAEIDDRLRFIPTVTAEVERTFPDHWRAAFAKAMATARPPR